MPTDRRPAFALALAAALAVALLRPAPAPAASTCLQGANALADRRALDALRGAGEQACPCAAASSRRTYQQCVRQVIDDAVSDGTLRGDCRATARRIARGAACGSDRSPCGQVRSRSQRVGCRVLPASACTDRAQVAQTACEADTHCADVVDWSAGTCLDPRRPGPWAAGFRAMTYTRDSSVTPGTPRVLDTSIWYPAPAGSGPVGASGGVDNAPLDVGGGPYPVVLFSHGSCGYPQQSKFLTPLLASHGFIVVAPPHPGNTIADLPNCNSGAAITAAVVERPQDMIFVLDRILAAGLDPGSPFFAAVDADRVAMTGHSFGGLTTYLVTAVEPRIDVAVALAPAALLSSTLPVPSLTMLGVLDSVISNPNARNAFERAATPKWLVEIEHAGHYAFSDFCFPGSDCNPPVTLTSAEAHDAALRFIVPFLQVHLAGDADWAPLLAAPTRTGFVYRAEE